MNPCGSDTNKVGGCRCKTCFNQLEHTPDNNYHRAATCGNCRHLHFEPHLKGNVVYYEKTCLINPKTPVRYTDGYEKEYVCGKHEWRE